MAEWAALEMRYRGNPIGGSNPPASAKIMSISDNAKRVFKGVIFDVWQWEQEMFDGSTATFEKVSRPATVEVIATVGDKILIEQQDQPGRMNNVNLVSGRMESDDMLAEAKRELLEETGYASEDWELFMKHDNRGKVLHDVYYFIARNCKKVQEPQLDAGERIETKLISFEELINLSNEPRFWVGPEFIIRLLRMQMDPKQKEEFRKKLFPKL